MFGLFFNCAGVGRKVDGAGFGGGVACSGAEAISTVVSTVGETVGATVSGNDGGEGGGGGGGGGSGGGCGSCVAGVSNSFA